MNDRIILGPVEPTEPQNFPSEFNILVVDDDPTLCHSIVTGILQACKYEVLHYEKAADALKAIQTRKGRLDLVVTDASVAHIDRDQLFNNIQQQFKLPIVLMSCDDHEKFVLQSLKCAVALYVIEPSSVEEFQSLWHHLLAMTKGGQSTRSSELPHHLQVSQKGRPEPLEPSERKHMGHNSRPRKRQNLRWTRELQELFELKVKQIEDNGERAIPSKILDLMNVPHLERLHVASHLQKYRQHQKKLQLEKQNSLSRFWFNLIYNANAPRSSLGNDPANFSIPQGNLQFPIEGGSSSQKMPPAGNSGNISHPSYCSADFCDSGNICDAQAFQPQLSSLGDASTFKPTPGSNTNYFNFGAHDDGFDFCGWQFGDATTGMLSGTSSTPTACNENKTATDWDSFLLELEEMLETNEIMPQTCGQNQISCQLSEMVPPSYMPHEFTSLPVQVQQHGLHVSDTEDLEIPYNPQEIIRMLG